MSEDEALVAIHSEAIRARKRPAAVILLYLWELATALVAAAPVHAWASRSWGSHPDGDAVLFRPGGRELLAWLGEGGAALPIVLRTLVAASVIGGVAAQLPLGALLASLAFARDTDEELADAERRPPRAVTAMRVAISSFLPLGALQGLLTLGYILVFAIGAAVASAVESAFTTSLGDARAFQLHLVVLALFAILVGLVGVTADLARAAIVREAGLAYGIRRLHPAWNVMVRGIRVALTTARNRGLWRATGGWAWRAVAGAVLVGVGYVAAGALGGKAGGALVALAAIHQAIVFGRAALRASWLAEATRRIVPAQNVLLELVRAPTDEEVAPSSEASG